MHLSISGIDFQILVDPSFDAPDPPAVYAPFLSARRPAHAWFTCKVGIRMGRPHGISSSRECYRSGSAWVLSEGEDGERWVVHGGRVDASSQWTARLSPDLAEVEVTCGETVGRHPFTYPLDQIITTLILPAAPGLLVHAAGVVLDGKVHLLAGKSGAGKSTIARLLVEGGVGNLLSDDRIILRKADGHWLACGTPWPGEGGMARNDSFPLGGFLFLHQETSHDLRALSKREALEKLLPVISVPWYDEKLMTKSLEGCEMLLSSVPAYELSFARDVSVGRFLAGELEGCSAAP